MSAISIPARCDNDLKIPGEKAEFEDCLRTADIEINGRRPWDIQVYDDRLDQRVWAEGWLGFGDSYMDGWWDCNELDGMMYRLFQSGLHTRFQPDTETFPTQKTTARDLRAPHHALAADRQHYDVGNDLYRCMLDHRMIYSCAYWEGASNLDQAQEAKLDLICRKLRLAPGMRVLDIGCGWGGAARFAAERYGVSVVGVTVSREQAFEARNTCYGLPIDISLQDYRDIRGRFDRIYSLEMFEHVGYEDYPDYMRVVADCLEPDGLFLLQTTGSTVSDSHGNPWVERHTFPGSRLPSCRQIADAAEGLLMIEDWHRFEQDYDRTLTHWWRNIDRNWDALKRRYNYRFCRMWRYYLLSVAGAFRAHQNQLWHIVMSPIGSTDSARRYVAVR